MKQIKFQNGMQREEKESRYRESSKALDDISKEVNTLRQEVSNLSAGSSNPLARFGRECQAVLAKIKASKQFRKQPIGPVGAYVNIKEERWHDAVLSVIGKSVKNFIVDNHEDCKLLQRIFRECH